MLSRLRVRPSSTFSARGITSRPSDARLRSPELYLPFVVSVSLPAGCSSAGRDHLGGLVGGGPGWDAADFAVDAF